jgi:hypothetical protein
VSPRAKFGPRAQPARDDRNVILTAGGTEHHLLGIVHVVLEVDVIHQEEDAGG